MAQDEEQLRFQRLVVPHAGAAYNLARWLTRNDHDAHDVTQEAMLRALRYFGSMRGENARPWLLQIVRHTCFSWLSQNRPAEVVALNEYEETSGEIAGPASQEPQVQAARNSDRARLNWALKSLPTVYREVVVLRELEDLSYREIAHIVDAPVGTVMSRLARGREQLRKILSGEVRRQLQPVRTGARREATGAA